MGCIQLRKSKTMPEISTRYSAFDSIYQHPNWTEELFVVDEVRSEFEQSCYPQKNFPENYNMIERLEVRLKEE